MQVLTDRLFVALAKRAGFPALSELKRCRDLQIEWIRAGTPATLFVVSQIEGVIDPEQTLQFEGWAREAIAAHPDRRALCEQVHSPTEEVEVSHAFRQPAEPEDPSTEEDAFGPWIPDQDLLADDLESEDPDFEDDELELLPENDDADMVVLGRGAPVRDGSDLCFVSENEAGEAFHVLASREFDTYKPAPKGSEEVVFAHSEHTELFDEDDEDDEDGPELELDFDLGLDPRDPLADVLADLEGQLDGPPVRDSAFDGLVDVCEDSDAPPPAEYRLDAAPRSNTESGCEDGLRLRARKRTRMLAASSGTRPALRRRPKVKRSRSTAARWRS